MYRQNACVCGRQKVFARGARTHSNKMRRRSSLGARCVSVCACVQGLRVCCLLCERYGFFSCCCCFAPNLFCCLDALRSFASAGINKRVQLGLPGAVPRRVRAHMHVTHTHTRTRPIRLLCLGRHRGAGAGECGAVRWIKSAGRDCVQTKGQERPRGGGAVAPFFFSLSPSRFARRRAAAK